MALAHPAPNSRVSNTRLPLARPAPRSRWVARRALANSSQDDIARAPTWKDTLKGALFWANPDHWDKVPRSPYLRFTFMFLKVVGTIGGYRGRAAFARRSGLKGLMQRRENALAVVQMAYEMNVDAFPAAAERLRAAAKSAKWGGVNCVAVILPCYARSKEEVKELRATLLALQAQKRPPDVVVVVDDHSPIDATDALKAWKDPESLAHVQLWKNVGPAGARSVGLRLLRQWAQGLDVVVCLTDSDAAPDPGWTEAMLKAQIKSPGIVSGPTMSVDRSHTGRFHDHFGNLNGRWTWDDKRDVLLYGCTCNFSVDLNSIGDAEFDPIFSRPGFEDIEFCWRLRVERGVYTRYCDEAKMFHQYDRGPIGLYKQFWKYGHTEPIMAWMHPQFTFQGSRPVTLGWRDPRDPEEGGPAAMAKSAVRGLDGVVRFLKWQTKPAPRDEPLALPPNSDPPK
ncbi:unnamed protein product [Symbiodinium natans]|uniref:Glycosyltransferase 2-like domain-containing protein n=1 Tax=Symbiodinium natans TaxID=878477 RepID=A0A812U3V8_9DINO|nr:unnamed protein product [Symbiodinium natans]